MSSVSDPADAHRQENRDINETPVQHVETTAVSNAGGKEDVEPQQLKNGNQDTSVAPLALHASTSFHLMKLLLSCAL